MKKTFNAFDFQSHSSGLVKVKDKYISLIKLHKHSFFLGTLICNRVRWKKPVKKKIHNMKRGIMSLGVISDMIQCIKMNNERSLSLKTTM